MRKILIRFDDICPTMDYIQWNRTMKLCDQYSVKPLIGVIPFCQDPELMIEDAHTDFWDYILKLQKRGYTVAMHGYRHVYDSKTRGLVDLVNKSEFVDEFLELSLFFKAFQASYSELLCIFPCFCPYGQFTRESFF